jgi:Winged helix-turn helix
LEIIMARPASGADQIEAAKASLKSATTADQIRAAQSVLLPLELGLTLAQTARAIGRSVGATCRMRTTFCAVAAGTRPAAQSKRALRNRAKATLEQEAAALDKVLHDAAQGGVVVIPRIKPLVEKALGKTIALSGLYRMLHRHDWRKLAPDTQHPKGDPQARDAWKKNSPSSSKKL